ncbi:hypothetical protein EDC04DRAFT_2006732 [Pisolithus marmoratus]|nr:hypothetical protein EDC04DRAFT_2006732 [Pisolithus marmoratus]
MSNLLPTDESSRQRSARAFLRIARSQAEATVSVCHLYSIPSRSSCYHEFLLVHMDTGLMSSSGGVARDTITIMRAREDHEYWQSASQSPVCKAPYLPILSTIIFILDGVIGMSGSSLLPWLERFRLVPWRALRRSRGGGFRCLGATSRHKSSFSWIFILSLLTT